MKRDHQEIGAEIVDAAFEDQDAFKLISDIGVIEFYAAFAKKARMGEIGQTLQIVGTAKGFALGN